MDRNIDLIKILIPAVGGQGGGVLTEWLVQLFLIEGFEVQGVGLPGLSQRGGSTMYYLEAYSKVKPDPKPIIFSQYPLPGDIDIILAQEFLELGRVLELGYGSDKTTIVSSTHRIYSTLEKMPLSNGIYSDENLHKLANAFSSRFVGLDALALAKEYGMDELAINAILLGALGTSASLPIAEASFLKAISQVGIAVENNIKAFRIGWDYIKSNKYKISLVKSDLEWDELKSEKLAKVDPGKREGLFSLLLRVENEYPERLREILAEALYRLTDYQDIWYAENYLDTLKNIYQIDKNSGSNSFLLSEAFAKNLALWMSYEDGIRVAELKINPERFKRIQKEMQLRDDQVFHVIDYLNPDAEEIYGLLPNVLVSPIVKLTDNRLFKKIWPNSNRITFAQSPTTSSFFGSLRLWFLTKLKKFRPYSYRFRKEHSYIKKYAAYVERYSKTNYALGCLVAKSGSMVKGYGKVRRRTLDSLKTYLEKIIDPIADSEKEIDNAFNLTLEIGEKSLYLISASTDGIEKAEKLANSTLKKKAA